MSIETLAHSARIILDNPETRITFTETLNNQSVTIHLARLGRYCKEIRTTVSAKDFLEATEHIRQIIEAENGN